MNWIINMAGKFLVGRRSKLAGVGCFGMFLLGIVVNVRPDLLPMVDVMSWDATGAWFLAGLTAFGFAGKAEKAIEAVKENTAAVKEASTANVTATGEVANVVQTIVTPPLTDEQRETLNQP